MTNQPPAEPGWPQPSKLTVCGLGLCHVELAQSEVAEGDVADVVDEDVFGLEVAVDDVELVQVLERAEQLGGVEPAALLVEAALTLEVVEELATVDERQAQVQLLGTLKRELERDDERVVDLGQHRSLGERVRHLAARDNVRLAESLERVDPTSVLLANLHDLAKEEGISLVGRGAQVRAGAGLSGAPFRMIPCR